jgi:hypothetical protein
MAHMETARRTRPEPSQPISAVKEVLSIYLLAAGGAALAKDASAAHLFRIPAMADRIGRNRRSQRCD